MSIKRLVKAGRLGVSLSSCSQGTSTTAPLSTLELQTGGMTCVCLRGTGRDSTGQRDRATVHAKPIGGFLDALCLSNFGPPTAPHLLGLSCFEAGMGWLKNCNFRVLLDNLCGPLLGDHLVTIGVRIKPWGGMWHKLDRPSAASGRRKHRFWPVSTVLGKSWLAYSRHAVDSDSSPSPMDPRTPHSPWSRP